MMQSEIQELNYFALENSTAFPPNFALMQTNFPALQFSRYLTNSPSYQTSFASELSNSTSDEADDHQVGVIDERKQRRMISNRESARRSRMRKQRHLDELWSQVHRLRTENHNLMDKISHVCESHDRVAEENARLKGEVSDLRQILTDIQINNSCAILRDLEDIRCDTAHLRDESSDQSVTTSADQHELFH